MKGQNPNLRQTQNDWLTLAFRRSISSFCNKPNDLTIGFIKKSWYGGGGGGHGWLAQPKLNLIGFKRGPRTVIERHNSYWNVCLIVVEEKVERTQTRGGGSDFTAFQSPDR